MELRKATKQKVKLRIGLAGLAGSGKTYSALLMASGITKWDKIALIDTENGSGDLYSDLGDYNVFPIQAPFTPEKYIQAIRACENAGMEVIIIDSISHEWEGAGGCLESNELIAHSKFRGNTWAAWSVTTPRHRKFVQAILESSCHVITTVRRKQTYEMSESNGKKTVTKVGLKEITRDGYEYEVTLNLDLTNENFASVSKTRISSFPKDMDPFIITKETGKDLVSWSKDGAEPIPVKEEVEPNPEPVKAGTSNGKPHLLALQKALKARGAKTTAEAIKLMNKLCPGKFESFDMGEGEAAAMLETILRVQSKKEADAKGAAKLFGDAKPKKKVTKKTSSNSPSKKSK